MPVRAYPLIVLYAAAMHVIWAIALGIDPAASGATALFFIVKALGYQWTITVLFVTAIAATAGLAYGRDVRNAAMLVLPQQFILFFSATTAIMAIWDGRFADGVERSHWFILADQCPAVLLALAHMVAVKVIWWRDMPL